jgi:putative membrane protein
VRLEVASWLLLPKSAFRTCAVANEFEGLWCLGTTRRRSCSKPIVIATGVIIALGATSAGVAAAKLTDPQIAHIVVTADDLDIANAKQALQKSKNAEVQRFANRMIADHGSVTAQAVALAKKLKITPEDNPTSKSLKDAQDANRTKLNALSGAAFDKAYADNEAAYHKVVDDALSNTLIPDAQNAQLKSLLEDGLKLFQDHLRDAQNMVKQLSVAHQ